MKVTLKRTESTFEEDLKKLLSNKDKLVEQEGKGNRNKYQIEVQKLKDQMKAYKKGGGEGYVSFGKLLKNVKGQEREGKFDRGAEDKTKKKLRKKMMDKKDFSKKGGVHAGTQADKEAELHQKVMDDPEIKEIKQKAKKKKSVHGSR